MQQLPNNEKTDSKEGNFYLKGTKQNGRQKVCVKFKTDTDNLNFVVYRYRNKMYLKGNEIDLKLTGYQSLLTKRVYFLRYDDIVLSSALYWMKQQFVKETNSVKNGCSLSNEYFPIASGIKIFIWTR